MEDYWSKSVEDVLKSLNSSMHGLSNEEAKRRLKKYGLNDVPKRKEKSSISIFISQFKSPLILTLLFASIISLFLGSIHESSIILSIIMINCFLGFFQEHKSEKALQKLCKYIRYKAKVFRDGRLSSIDTREIVPGDIIYFETGDRIPADLRIIEAEELEIDESLITGESFPSQKIAVPIKLEKFDAHKAKNIAFMGTLVTNGKGKGVVIATGMKSSFGEVVGYLKSEEVKTEYQKGIERLSSFLVKGILVGVAFIFTINFWTGKKILDSLIFSLALAVGMVPEALPIVITIGLSRGAIKMSNKGVIVKRLVSIEDLGDMDVLCVDKTGTLTENKISLVEFFDLDGKRNEEIVELALHCISVIEKGNEVFGNPLDVAIYEFAKRRNLIKKYEILDEIPFDYERRRMSVVLKKENKILLVCKGAPESLVEVCSRMKNSRGVVEIDKKEIEEKFENLTKNGYKVLALAYKVVEKKRDYEEKDEKDLVFLGFLCFLDPPKITAKESIPKVKELGIEIKILTGDHPLIASKIAQELGIEVKGCVKGEEIDNISEEKLEEIVENNTIFARLTPAQKVKIISALKKRHVVGFIGDGVNDAPALKVSDVGISVENASDVAKESADIILTRKSLKILVEGIKEGRKTFSNTTKYILNTISANIGNMTTLALISPILNFLPLLPSQVLLTNLITDGVLLSISTDRVDEDEMKKPKRFNIKFIRNFSLFFGGISSMFDFITIFLILLLLQASFSPSLISLPPEKQVILRTCWFLECVLSEIFVTFAIRTKKRFYKSKPGEILILTSLIFSLLTFVLIYSPLSSILEFVAIDYFFLNLVFLILICYFGIVEISKSIFFKKFVLE